MLEHCLPTGYLLDKRYKIVNLIQAGGMGAVYKAEDTFMDNRIVAVKEMLDAFSTNEERCTGIDRFLSEIAVLESLHHPNIPKVTDHFFLEHDKERFYYFVMEYIDGIDLSSYLDKYGENGLPENQVIKWAIQVCEALEYIHNFDPPVTHRDIKSSNIIYRFEDHRVLLIDFGIARVTNPGDGYWIGTPGYAPPEQQMGKPEPRSDFYALGATMHELLTGVPPEDFNFPTFKELGIKISPELEEFVWICLNYNPVNRAVNAKEMTRYLREILKEDMDLGPLPDEFVFESIVRDFREKFLDARLQKFIKRYGNEAHTKHIPKRLDYFNLTLSCPTNFELIIKTCYKEKSLKFFEKQGILEKKLLGEVNPSDPGEENKVNNIIDKFIEDYELFKSANWGGGEGFVGFGNLVSNLL